MIDRVNAALRKVQKVYLKYPAAGNILRFGERVFAYEFYHQLRIVFNDLQLDINGEPMKGHELLPNFDHAIFPDFIIHNYTIHDNNEVVIEVKVTPRLNARDIFNDLRKLDDMINGQLGYNHGIFFAGNCDVTEKIRRSRLYFQKIVDLLIVNPKIIIWNTLPFHEGIDMREFLTKENIISITGHNFIDLDE